MKKNSSYFNKLFVVAMAANKVIEGAEKIDRYKVLVNRRRINTLRRALEALRKQ